MKILVDMNLSPHLGDVSFGALGESVIRAVNAVRDQLEQGAIVTLDILNRRVRLLPIG